MNNERIAKLRAQGKSLREISSVAGLSHEAIRKRLKLVSTLRSVLSTPADAHFSRQSVNSVNPPTSLSIVNIIPESVLRDKLRLPKAILGSLKKKGLPFLDLEGKVYFHEQIFVQWVLNNSLKIAEAIKSTPCELSDERDE